MQTDVDTQIIARIVGKVKAAMGAPIDEDKLSSVLSNSLRELKAQDSERYLDVIQDLSQKLEDMATELGKLYAQQHTG